jgi:hypothetical protein
MVFSFFRQRRSSFEPVLRQYGFERCSVSGTTLLIGLGPDDRYRRRPITEASIALSTVGFLEAPEQAELIAAYCASSEALALRSLMVGTSHDYKAREDTRHRCHDAVAALSKAQFPALRTLSVGDMEKLFNGSSVFGKLGDVGGIFDAAPQLDDLSLHGNFELNQPVRHATLRRLNVWVQEIGGTEGPLSQSTVDSLLLSSFPRATDISLQLEEWDAGDYAIPERFFTRNGFPALKTFDIDMIAPADMDRLSRWKVERGLA